MTAGHAPDSLFFLMTDVEGSTKLWEDAPEDMARALERHDAIVVETVSRHNGRLVKHRGEGDSAFAVFDRAVDALACTLSLQRDLQSEPWPQKTPIWVRMAVHAGVAQYRNGDYYGSTVNRVARIRAIAHGGQALVTPEATEGAPRGLPPGAELQDLGSHRLKDLSRPQRVLMLCHPDLRREFPPLNSLETKAHNLPVQLTTFVGRERELADVRTLLAGHRLVSLTGAGGCGKTRLALQVAADIAGDLRDGVFLADLAPVTDEGLVGERVAAALGERVPPGAEPTVDFLADRLADRELMIVLDNCEHLIGTAASFADSLLRSCGRVRILATSREVLGVPGEAVYRVPSLGRPDPSHSADADELLAFESVSLFCDRAELAGGDVRLTADNASAVARICSTLEGIPLAIELAAARTAALSPVQIADRLEDRFGLLTSGTRTALPRHQTLRALVDWSHELLDPAERTLLRRLSAFLGGFVLEGAEAVGAGMEGSVVDVLGRLVDKSLVTVGDDGRFGMLETIRQYARERLSSSDEEDEIRGRHLRWLVESAAARRPGMTGPKHAATAAWFDAEHDNIRAALHWGIPAEQEDAVQLCNLVWTYWQSRGHLSEGRYWLREAVDHAAGALRAELLHGGGRLAMLQGDVAAAGEQFDEALPLAEADGREALISGILNGVGTVFMARGDFGQAERILSQALEMHRRLDAPAWIVATLNALAVIATTRGEFERAEQLYAEGLDRARAQENIEAVQGLLMNLGNMAAERNDVKTARQRFEECLAYSPEVGSKQWTGMAKHNLAALLAHEGEFAQARQLFEESLALKRELGDVRGIAHSQGGLADLLNAQGRYAEAAALLKETLANFIGMGAKVALIEVLQTMAVSCVGLGDAERAARILGASSVLREAIDAPAKTRDLEEIESITERLRRGLGEPRLAELHAQGRDLSPEQAVELADHLEI